MVKLSFSSLDILHNHPHCWLLKQMGIPQPENIYMKEGKTCHRLIQDHVARIKTDDRLKHILINFPIVERGIWDKEKKMFDPDCWFEFPVGDYLIRGYYDGLDLENKRFLEIKSSSTLWSMVKFQESMQRKLYALAHPELEEAYLITCSRQPEDWVKELPKVYKCPLTPQDRLQAQEWINEGIKILEVGDFKSDLVEGKCLDPYCYWGKNCQFK